MPPNPKPPPAALRRDQAGWVAMLYGPGVVETEVAGTHVCITEETRYPFDLTLTFTLDLAAPTTFDLAFRVPGWARGFTLDAPCDAHQVDGLLVLRKRWQTNDHITLHFEVEPQINAFGDEAFFSHGPLLFALPLASEAHVERTYQPGFRDLTYAPVEDTGADLRILAEQPFTLVRSTFNPARPWHTLVLSGHLWDTSTHTLHPVGLRPLGATILRRVTFSM
ncbi:MAG: hypothetical protein GVY30_04020 [Chloroflexi bacterium]|nr:hypothetical protein [Chloroflexota bacterium]